MPNDIITSQKAKKYKKRGPKRKRKHRDAENSDEDFDIDPYSAKIKRQNTCTDECDSKQSFIGDHNQDEEFQIPKSRLSREERKLQYYLDSIKRQEKEADKKSKRKGRKSNTSNKTMDALKMEKIGELDKPLKISLVKGAHPEFEFLTKQLNESQFDTKRRPKINAKKYIADEDYNYNGDEGISCTQSEDQNESTFDNQRTPTQHSLTLNSIINLWDETGGVDFALSQDMEKSSHSFSELGENKEDLTKKFWANLLQQTLLRQEEIRDLRVSGQLKEIKRNNFYWRPRNINFKPIFKISKIKRT